METIELLSAVVTGILVVVLFVKLKGARRPIDLNKLPSARPEDIECVRRFMPDTPDQMMNAIAHSIRSVELIKAITIVRTIKNLGLKESKELVEAMKTQMK